MLRLITFDADGTLYADGAHIEHDNEMIRHIIALMRRCGPCRQGRAVRRRRGAGCLESERRRAVQLSATSVPLHR